MELLSTLGPSSLNKQTLKKLQLLGVSLFRVNLSHTEVRDLKKIINFIRKHSTVPICIDTEGAQIRTRLDKQITLKTSQELEIFFNDQKNKNKLNFYPLKIYNQLKIGDIIYIDFNSVVVEIVEIKKSSIKVFVINGGVVQTNKGVAVNKKINMEPLTDKDLKAIKIGKEMNIKNFALSFCSESKDVKKLRSLLDKECKIISKIENVKGFENCAEICRYTDSILIDRGDLSREFKIEDIPLIQKEIVKIAKSFKRKIFVATNFLESMITNDSPNRAEINDIYNTLLDGASGLVLAAETAIGKYPVKSASIIKRVYDNFKKKLPRKIKPSEKTKPYDERTNNTIIVDSFSESDIKQILFGTYSPLDRFMDLDEINSVLNKNQLRDGSTWTLPIVLPIKKNKKELIQKKQIYEIKNNKKDTLCLMQIENVFEINDDTIYKNWFSCNDLKHPGILNLKSRGDFFISGKIINSSLSKNVLKPFEATPKKVKEIIYSKGWHTIVGFHTRNIPHQGHIFIQKKAIEKVNADGIILSPLIGIKKKGDFSNDFIMKSYKELIKSNIHKNRALLCFLDIYPRYAGPREAIFTAQCRKNLGCTHFIIGRDHSGLSNYYENNDINNFYQQTQNLGIELILFDNVGYDSKKKKYGFYNGKMKKISGSMVRDYIKSKKKIPNYLLNKFQHKVFEKWKKGFFF